MNLQLIVILYLFLQNDKARITNTAFTVVALKEYKKAYEDSSTDTSVSQSLIINAIHVSLLCKGVNLLTCWIWSQTCIHSIPQFITKLDTSITKAESFISKRFTSVSEKFCTYGLSLSVYALHKSPVSSDRLKGLMKNDLQKRIQPSKECTLN